MWIHEQKNEEIERYLNYRRANKGETSSYIFSYIAY